MFPKPNKTSSAQRGPFATLPCTALKPLMAKRLVPRLLDVLPPAAIHQHRRDHDSGSTILSPCTDFMRCRAIILRFASILRFSALRSCPSNPCSKWKSTPRTHKRDTGNQKGAGNRNRGRDKIRSTAHEKAHFAGLSKRPAPLKKASI